MNKLEKGQVASILGALYDGREYGWGCSYDVPGKCYDLIKIAKELWPDLCKSAEEGMAYDKKKCEEEDDL